MKNILVLLLACLISFAGWSQSYADDNRYERILRFHSDIKIKKNRKVLVTETIKVKVDGNEIKRGIYRSIPLWYEGTFSTYRVAFDLKSVKKDGEIEPYHTEWEENGIVIYIGEENVLLDPNYYTYEIQYELDYVVQMLDDLDELFWNVNGNGWQITADTVSATFYLPEGATAKQYKAYTGAYGDKGKDFKIEDKGDTLSVITTRELYVGEGLSVAVGWDKGFVDPMTSGEKFAWHLWLYALIYLGLLTILIGFVFNFYMWFRYGRDPKPGTIIPRFYPPEEMSPAECAYLMNEGRDTKEIYGATILSLAVKRWITIERKGDGHYRIERTEEDGKSIGTVEKAFLRRILKGDVTIIKKGKHNSRVQDAYTQMPADIDTLQKNKYYLRNNRLKWLQFIFPAITLLVGFIAYFKLGGNFLIPIVATILHLVLNLIFSRLYEQPTRKGRKRMDEIEGFKMYLSYADQDRINTMNRPEMTFEHFEENLPFAVAFGLSKEWTDQFDVNILEDMDRSMPYLYGFHYHLLGAYMFSSMGSDMSSAISSAATPPSAGGSGGGFSGGSGFSGGGFGGGGGGGW